MTWPDEVCQNKCNWPWWPWMVVDGCLESSTPLPVVVGCGVSTSWTTSCSCAPPPPPLPRAQRKWPPPSGWLAPTCPSSSESSTTAAAESRPGSSSSLRYCFFTFPNWWAIFALFRICCLSGGRIWMTLNRSKITKRYTSITESSPHYWLTGWPRWNTSLQDLWCK